ncbi:hypothetical protein Tco_0373382 [Tanacetum coccineum]
MIGDVTVLKNQGAEIDLKNKHQGKWKMGGSDQGNSTLSTQEHTRAQDPLAHHYKKEAKHTCRGPCPTSQLPSESEGIFDNTCDVPSCDKKHFDAESALMESLLNRDTSIVYSPKIDSPSREVRPDDDSFEDIDYVEASPPDSELVSIEEVEDDILPSQIIE